MSLAELTSTSATDLAALIGERRASAEEVVEAHVRRIEAVNPSINAVVQLDAERALARARECDAGPADGPLHGVPFTVKDNIEAEGVVMAIGAPERAGVVAGADATVVARMKAAGAILLGKTNCPPYGGGIETDNEVYGLTRNPYDPERTRRRQQRRRGRDRRGRRLPVRVRDRLRRQRAAAGALLRRRRAQADVGPGPGHRRDRRRGPDRGAGRRPHAGRPVARSVADLALLLRVAAGPDGRDGGVAPVPLAEPDTRALAGLRVATFTEDDFFAADADTAATVASAAAALGEAGARVEQARHPGGGHELTIEVWRSYGGDLRSDELYRLLRRWDAFRAEMLAFAERYDLVLCPVFASAARRHGDVKREGEADPTSFTTPFSLTGWPVATVRCGTSAGGLPIGVQVAAAPWRDDLALAAALELERALGGWRPPPL